MSLLILNYHSILILLQSPKKPTKFSANQVPLKTCQCLLTATSIPGTGTQHPRICSVSMGILTYKIISMPSKKSIDVQPKSDPTIGNFHTQTSWNHHTFNTSLQKTLGRHDWNLKDSTWAFMNLAASPPKMAKYYSNQETDSDLLSLSQQVEGLITSQFEWSILGFHFQNQL